MARPENPRYGTMNTPLVMKWFEEKFANDGTVWFFNLMKYRPYAIYDDGVVTNITGIEADDLYNPSFNIDEMGGMVAYIGIVVDQAGSHNPQWHRIATVRYPSRKETLKMFATPAFVELHEHKDAGMEFTVCAQTTPSSPANIVDKGQTVIIVEHESSDAAFDPTSVANSHLVASFDVEGSIMGDGRVLRSWHQIQVEGDVDVKAIAALSPHISVMLMSLEGHPDYVDHTALSIQTA